MGPCHDLWQDGTLMYNGGNKAVPEVEQGQAKEPTCLKAGKKDGALTPVQGLCWIVQTLQNKLEI